MTLRRCRLAWGGLLAVLLLAEPNFAAAQTLTTGLLEGMVKDSLGVPLHEARVTATEVASGESRSATTGRDGRFELSLLPPGDYLVVAERLGYLPLRVQGVPVRPDQRLTIALALAGAGAVVDQAQAVRFEASPVAGTRAGVSQWFSRPELVGLPYERREITEVARLSTRSNSELETEGLPARLSGLAVDGIPAITAHHPDLAVGSLSAAAFPLSAFQAAELLTNAADVEWSGFGGGLLSGYTRRGTQDFQALAFGAWSGDALFSSKFFDAGAVPHSDLLGGLLLSGPIERGVAAFAVGAEARRFETPTPELWGSDAIDPQLLQVAQNSYGIDLAGYERPQLRRTEAVSAFGRLDWRLTPEHALSARLNLATVPFSTSLVGSPRGGPLTPFFDGSDFSSAATLTSQLDREWASELRVGYETSTRDYGGETQSAAEDVLGAGVPSTFLVAGGTGFGSSASLPGQFERATLRANGTLYFHTGAHRLKGGLGAALFSYGQTYAYGSGGEFFFSDVDAFARQRGSFVRTADTPVATEFDVPQYALYVQDTWNARPGLDLLLGLRFEREQRPGIRGNQDLSVATGLETSNILPSRSKLSPRVGLTWDVQQQHRWLLRGTAGVYHDMVDPGLLAELVANSGGTEILRAVGRLSSYPELPESDLTSLTRVTLFGPNFDAPRTARVSFGVTRSLESLAALHVSTTFRRTDFLPRRDDINLSAGPRSFDQYGRPVYGALVQQGGLLAADPGSNRRFRGYDLLSALNADGRSDYLGVTMALERHSGGPFNWFGSYTFSQTTDNWLSGRGGGPDAQLSPFPDSLNGMDWAEGRSDFDVPHRLVVGGDVRLPLPLEPRLGAVYRFRSGHPFTPGFRVGVDANGDGSPRNDPAFVDDRIPGVADLFSEWSCLREQVGRFAERNACREPGVHTLDLQLGVNIVRVDRYSAEIFVDGFNLIESDVGERDAALYLVDGSRSLTVDPETGNVAVPLVVNPNFGDILFRRTPGRTLRLGLRMSY